VLTHLDHTLADRLYVTQITERRLAEPGDEPTLRRPVAQTFQPDIELGQRLDDVHATSVIGRLPLGKTAMNNEGPLEALPIHWIEMERVMGIEHT
jgi:hypothetical protein